MITQSTDTNPKAERFLISLIQKSSFQGKFSRVQSFTSSILALSRRAIHRANPNLSERERDILFVKLHYGNELAMKLQEYLNRI